MALNLPLPKQFLTHAHWTMGHEKMSKTTGNVVDPFQALERFGIDTMRFYMAHDGGLQDDADYENAFIIERYKKGLQGGLGNLVSRVVRGKGWSVPRSVERAAKGTTAPFDFGSLRTMAADTDLALATALKVAPNNPELVHISSLRALPRTVMDHFERLDPRKALHEIMSVVYKVCTCLIS